VSTCIAFMLGQWLEEFIESTLLFQRKSVNARHNKSKAAVILSTTPQAVQEKAETALLSSSNTGTRFLRLRRRRSHHEAMAYPPRYVETIRQIAAKKRQLEKEVQNDKGLVILQATIWRSPLSSSSASHNGFHYLDEEDAHYLRQEDVTDLLQYWVVDSQLPRLYLWNRINSALSRHHQHHQRREQQWWRDWLCCNSTNVNVEEHEHRQKSRMQQLQDRTQHCYEKLVHPFYEHGYRQYLVALIQRVLGDNTKSAPKDVGSNINSNNTVMATMPAAAAAARLYIRYRYEGKVYEIEFAAPRQFCQKDGDHLHHYEDSAPDIWLPHPRAVVMGSADRVQ
jgi:hypothetical protein